MGVKKENLQESPVKKENLQESPVKKENDRNIANVIQSEEDFKEPITPKTPVKTQMILPPCEVRLMKGVIHSPRKPKLSAEIQKDFPDSVIDESCSDSEDCEGSRSEKRKRSVSNGSVDADRPPQKRAHVGEAKREIEFDSLRNLAATKRRLGTRGPTGNLHHNLKIGT